MRAPILKPVSIASGTLQGVDGVVVMVEASLGGAHGTLRILGRVEAGIREAYHRVVGAFHACGLPVPRGTPTINFQPAELRKTGSGFDLPMALALAAAAGQFDADTRIAAFGELSLRGQVLPVAGVVAVALALRAAGWRRLLTSHSDASLAAWVPGIEVWPVRDLAEGIAILKGRKLPDPATRAPIRDTNGCLDLSQIRGHQTPKTALMVAAAGRHNLLLVGPPGSGKTALARRVPGLLPPAGELEALEILKIQTLRQSGSALGFQRPLRAPHHTSSVASILGGGSVPRPGEVTLAQHGVLFLDEIAEFRREALEGLRQPLEEAVITVCRARAAVSMPADFLLVAAMNPCPCGYRGHPERPCTCTPAALQRYRGRVSGPLLDRLDLQVEVPALPSSVLLQPPDEDWASEKVRERILVAVARQQQRATCNGRLQDEQLDRAFGSATEVLGALHQVLHGHRLSGRARTRLMRIARTLADLDNRERVEVGDVLEAARLRGYEASSG